MLLKFFIQRNWYCQVFESNIFLIRPCVYTDFALRTFQVKHTGTSPLQKVENHRRLCTHVNMNALAEHGIVGILAIQVMTFVAMKPLACDKREKGAYSVWEADKKDWSPRASLCNGVESCYDHLIQKQPQTTPLASNIMSYVNVSHQPDNNAPSETHWDFLQII